MKETFFRLSMLLPALFCSRIWSSEYADHKKCSQLPLICLGYNLDGLYPAKESKFASLISLLYCQNITKYITELDEKIPKGRTEKVPWNNPLSHNSDKNEMSLHIITTCSNIQMMTIKKSFA